MTDFHEVGLLDSSGVFIWDKTLQPGTVLYVTEQVTNGTAERLPIGDLQDLQKKLKGCWAVESQLAQLRQGLASLDKQFQVANKLVATLEEALVGRDEKLSLVCKIAEAALVKALPWSSEEVHKSTVAPKVEVALGAVRKCIKDQ